MRSSSAHDTVGDGPLAVPGTDRARRRGSRRSFLWLAILVALLALPSWASAQEKSFGFQVTVLHTSPDGKVGPKARRFHRLLGRRVKYGGIRVVNSKAVRVKMNNIGGIKLPDGTRFRFRPIDGRGPGALVAIDMGQTQGDFRLPAGKPLILGGSSWRGGKLVVVLELTE